MHWPIGIFPVCQTQDILPVIFWSFVLLVLLGLMFVAILWLKKWMASDDSEMGSFTLGDLRRLKASGQMSEEEYEKAKIQIVGAVKLAAQKLGAPPKPTAVSKPFPVKTATTDPTIPLHPPPSSQTPPPPSASNPQDSRHPPPTG